MTDKILQRRIDQEDHMVYIMPAAPVDFDAVTGQLTCSTKLLLAINRETITFIAGTTVFDFNLTAGPHLKCRIAPHDGDGFDVEIYAGKDAGRRVELTSREDNVPLRCLADAVWRLTAASVKAAGR